MRPAGMFFHPIPVAMKQFDFEITPQELQQKLSSGDVKLVDVREPVEWQTARIDGAKHIPMGDIPLRAHTELDPDEHIVVYCHHGVRSANVTMWLRQQGFDLVQSLRGGIHRWALEVDPTVPTY